MEIESFNKMIIEKSMSNPILLKMLKTQTYSTYLKWIFW
jgi:hypothetical protein